MDQESGKRKRKTISLEQKAAMIKAVESGTKKSRVAQDFGIAVSTLSTILASREAITNAVTHGVKGSRKKLRTAAFKPVEDALFKWFLNARAANITVSGEILQRKARDFACIMGYDSFVASAGWLQRFKERHDIVGKTVVGESRSVDEESAAAWVKESVGTLREKYSSKDIFNADETGLFFQMLPNKTLALRGQMCHGGKHSKQRITVLLCANMDGSEKLPAFVVGKSASPRCFKGKRQLKVQYVSNRKSWMTRDIFAEWLRNWDDQLQKQNRKVCLLIDNCTAHYTSAAPRNIELCFLPPNCTSLIQPLDQGIIMSFKAGYRKRLIDRILLNTSLQRETKIDLYSAIEMLQAAWMSVSANTIANCFRHALGEVATYDSASAESDDIVAAEENVAEGVEASWKALSDAGVVADNELFYDYVNADADAVTTEEPTDDSIVADVAGLPNTSDDEDAMGADSHSFTVPTSSQALDAVDLLRRFFGAHEDGENGMNAAATAEKEIFRLRRPKQRSIVDFFLPSAIGQ